MKNKFSILFALLALGVMSCDLGDDPADGGTATEAVAGEYFTQLFDTIGGSVLVDYSLVTISNTAANTDNQIRINDNENVWGFNSVFNVNLADSTFSGEKAVSATYEKPALRPYLPVGTLVTVGADYPKYMTITGGRIFGGVAHVPSGTTADSIAFSATALYYLSTFEVVAWKIDTISKDPVKLDTSNVFQYIEEVEDGPDGPYFLSGYRRTGFLEDEH